MGKLGAPRSRNKGATKREKDLLEKMKALSERRKRGKFSGSSTGPRQDSTSEGGVEIRGVERKKELRHEKKFWELVLHLASTSVN